MKKIKQLLNSFSIYIEYLLWTVDWFSVVFYTSALLLMTFIMYTFFVR